MSKVELIRQIFNCVTTHPIVQSSLLRRFVLFCAVLFLFGGLLLSLSRQPTLLRDIQVRPALLVIAIGVPATVVLNAIEYMFMGSMVGVRIPFKSGLRISIVASAANMLPLPGATIVRVAGLKAAGGAMRASTSVVGIVALIWIGVAFAFCGLAVSVTHVDFGAAFLALGVSTLVFALIIGTRVMRIAPRVLLIVLMIKLSLVLVDTFRIYLCLLSLGVGASYLQSSGFAISSVAGSAVSIVPAGLGVREAVSAAVAPLVDLQPSIGFLAASLNRLLALIVVVPCGVYLAYRVVENDGRP